MDSGDGQDGSEIGLYRIKYFDEYCSQFKELEVKPTHIQWLYLKHVGTLKLLKSLQAYSESQREFANKYKVFLYMELPIIG